MRNELTVFLAIQRERNITAKRAIEISRLPKSTFYSALARLVVKGVIANLSGNGKRANYQFDQIAIERFQAELSLHIRPHKAYNKFMRDAKLAIRTEHEKEIDRCYAKINPERLADKAQKRTRGELVTKVASNDPCKIPDDDVFREILRRYNQRNPEETDLGYWKRKLSELEEYPCLDGLFFTEKEIRKRINTFERQVAASMKSRLVTEEARRKGYTAS